MQTERRRERRQIAYLGAEVTYNQRRSAMDCLVRNIAPSGALVVFADRTPLPEEFDLEIPQRGRSFRGRVVWRHLDRAGLALESPAPDEALEHTRRRALRKESRTLPRRPESPI